MRGDPLTRARYVRLRLLRLMDDARHARAAAESARDQIAAVDNNVSAERARTGSQAQQALLAELRDTSAAVAAELQSQRAAITQLADTLDQISDQTHRNGRVLELIYEEEIENERRLEALRASSAYEQAFVADEPLVSVVIHTYQAYERLLDRALPSVFAQSYPNLEVVVVGDGAPKETAEALNALSDPRVRYENLTVRAPYPDDPVEFWHVAGTPAWNRAWALAEGQWIAPLNDDDAFRSDHIESLLRAARQQRCEVAYGAIEHHRPGLNEIVNSWPPESHRFGWQAAIVHSGLGFMRMQLGAGILGVPGDWSLCRRMRRSGVRFTAIEQVVTDYYPSGAWNPDRFR